MGSQVMIGTNSHFPMTWLSLMGNDGGTAKSSPITNIPSLVQAKWPGSKCLRHVRSGTLSKECLLRDGSSLISHSSDDCFYEEAGMVGNCGWYVRTKKEKWLTYMVFSSTGHKSDGYSLHVSFLASSLSSAPYHIRRNENPVERYYSGSWLWWVQLPRLFVLASY